jgi:hypothetical protein
MSRSIGSSRGHPKRVSHYHSSNSEVSTSWDEGTSTTGSHDNLFSSSEESRERRYRKQARHARYRAHEERKSDRARENRKGERKSR